MVRHSSTISHFSATTFCLIHSSGPSLLPLPSSIPNTLTGLDDQNPIDSMIKWTVYNLSEVDASVESTLSVPPHTTKAFHPASSSSTLRLAHHTFSLTTHPSKSWRRLLPLPNLSPTEKPLRFLLKAFQHRQTIVLLSTPPLHSWMSSLPDDLSLGDVTLPGTHQSTALYGVPVSQCQQPGTPLKVQLVDGIRFLGSFSAFIASAYSASMLMDVVLCL